MGLKRVVQPAPAISLEDAKRQCRLAPSETTDELLIVDYVAAATDVLELYLGRSIMPQTWELTLDAFSDTILLPRGPVQSIESVSYFDPDGVKQTLAAEAYQLDSTSDPAWLVLAGGAAWPELSIGVNNVVIRFVAGCATVPPSLLLVIRSLVAQMYDEPTLVPEIDERLAGFLVNQRSYAE
ncbi:hypothetical protein HMF7854_04435 [Sphingomonas ginkgonis]|uniref:Phage gp6-like head-tail connector protein n=1 Tax=Sphingomonas ginkgonis TaxID=2315330 RepID=A0A3R9X6Q9_9SPHN|nr:phage head-tail connector protein [Sphingomonas ginkgonis]RST30156.1 hypothetical protein HMF7854_04435 [Sphingomonas ginkgonis]